MYSFDIILYFLVGICLISSITSKLIFRNTKSAIILIIHFIPVVISFFYIILFNLSYFLVPIYISALILLLTYVVRNKRILSTILLVLSLVMFGSPLLAQLNYKYQNYSSMSYTKSFKAMNSFIKSRYPFQQHKKLDLDAKYQYYLELFEKADKDKSKKEYYLALKEYLGSFPDGHVSSMPLLNWFIPSYNDNFVDKLKSEYVGGGYGFSVIEIDDGRAIVNLVGKGSNAEKLGIMQGTVLTKWNGKLIKDAVQEVSLLWNMNGIPTTEHANRLKYAYLAMAPIGKSASISFISKAGTERTVKLKAGNSNPELFDQNLALFYHGGMLTQEREAIAASILEGGYGYIRISDFSPADETHKIAMINRFKNAIEAFKKRNVRALILDLRNNLGGEDDFAATILGFLSKKEIYYENENIYNDKTKSLLKSRDMISKPNFLGFHKDIIILANQNTISAGEGFVYNARKLPGVKTAGITGTNGSFGTIVSSDFIAMPGNYWVAFPSIACCEKNGKIMIDADYTGKGGIQPDIKIPFDLNAVFNIFQDGKDYELDYVKMYLASR